MLWGEINGATMSRLVEDDGDYKKWMDEQIDERKMMDEAGRVPKSRVKRGGEWEHKAASKLN